MYPPPTWSSTPSGFSSWFCAFLSTGSARLFASSAVAHAYSPVEQSVFQAPSPTRQCAESSAVRALVSDARAVL